MYPFEPLGPPIEYHGLRQPCIADCEALLTGMARKDAEYYRIVDAAYRGAARPVGVRIGPGAFGKTAIAASHRALSGDRKIRIQSQRLREGTSGVAPSITDR